MIADRLAALLAAVQARIEAFAERGDASGILAAAALEEAGQLWALAQEQPAAAKLQITYDLAPLSGNPGGARPQRSRRRVSAVRDGRTDSPDLVPDEIGPSHPGGLTCSRRSSLVA